MKTLLTGFGPFGDVVDNPTARIVERFAETGAEGHDLTARVLPVSFAGASEEIGRLLIDGRFDAAMMLGVAGRDSEIRVERFGRNQDAARIPDCDGLQPHGLIVESGPETYACGVDSAALVESIRAAGIPARESDSAGSYVCNRAYYAALHTIAANSLPTRCIFIHVPPDEHTFHEAGESSIPFESQVIAVRIALTAILGVI